MRVFKVCFLCSLSLLLAVIFLYGYQVRGGGSEIVINELLPNPEGSDVDGEFIELYNATAKKIDLEGWTLKDKKKEYEFIAGDEILAKDFLVIERSKSKIALNNSGEEEVELLDESGDQIDKVEYEDSKEDLSWSRNEDKKYEWTSIITRGKKNEFPKPIEYTDKIVINELLPNPEGKDAEGEWIELYYFGEKEIDLKDWLLEDKSGKKYTFGEKKIGPGEYVLIKYEKSKVSLNNSGEEVFLIDPNGDEVDKVEYGKDGEEDYSWARKDDGKFEWNSNLTPGEENKFLEPKKYPKNIYFNEILSNPDGKDKNNEWIEFFNANGFEVDLEGWLIENSSNKKFKIKSFKIGPHQLGVVYLKNTSFYIKNSKEKLKLLNPNGKEVDKIEMLAAAVSGATFNKKEEGGWAWSRFLTPGQNNKLNNLPRIKIDKPEKIYKNIKAEFSASKTKDKDKDKLKFRWDFGDGHRSYLEETSHIYEKIGKYLVVLRVDDGSEKIEKSFKVEVKKFPKREVKIIRLIPNPKGRDKGSEIIELENNSSKRVNLEGWKIATGSEEKKVVNHPIYDKILIKSGKRRIITQEECKFSLNNKKGVVVLKYPNGKVADMVKYEKEKIGDNEEYLLQNETWGWLGGEVNDSVMVKKNSQSGLDEDDEQTLTKGVSNIQWLWRQVAYNKEVGCCDSFKKIAIDNWREEMRIWLRFLG